ncbi:MAG: formiminoglutamase [Caulobacteraceae bacterium]|nr:formiminoglutamase [Caulobacteraceae bacterium]
MTAWEGLSGPEADLAALSPGGEETVHGPPFALVRALGIPSPFVFASPHSGREYPAELMDAAALDGAAIRRSEDAFVDELIGSAPDSGVTLLTARYARAYIDVNREAYELDPAMFEDELPAFARARTARVAAGLGSIARVVGDGQEIYRRKLTFEEARRRIEAVHRPYHVALAGLLEETRALHGRAALIDWHSMPSAASGDPAYGRKGCDMVLGDRFGSACAPGLTRLVERELEAMGYRVARNAPYAGGYTTEFYGRPAEGLHALQIEINRGVYLDEAALKPNAGFGRLKHDLDRLCATLARDWRKAF